MSWLPATVVIGANVSLDLRALTGSAAAVLAVGTPPFFITGVVGTKLLDPWSDVSKVPERGIFITEYPAVLGSDAAGIVKAVGEGVNDFNVGDNV